MGIFGGGSPQDQVDLAHVNDRLAKLESALASLQAQVALLTTGAVGAGAANPMAGTDPGTNVAGGAWMEEVRRLKDSDQLISAIKLYRQNTGVGLKEAKDIVEGMI